MKSGFASQGRMSGLCVAVGSLAVQEVGTGMGRNLLPGCCHLRILATSILDLVLFGSSSLS